MRKISVSVTVFLTSYLIISQSVCAVARSWAFKGETAQEKYIFGIYDNNYGESCVNIDGKNFKGIMPLNELERYIGKRDTIHFKTYFKVNKNKLEPLTKSIYLKPNLEINYIDSDFYNSKWMKRSEYTSLFCAENYQSNRLIKSGRYQQYAPDNATIVVKKGKLFLEKSENSSPLYLTRQENYYNIKSGIFLDFKNQK